MLPSEHDEAREVVKLSIRSSGDVWNYPCLFYRDPRNAETLRNNRRKLGLPENNAGVLIIYSGGTIGSAPSDDEDPLSPQVVKGWPVLRRAISSFADSTTKSINFAIDAVEFETTLDSSNVAPVEWVAIAQLLHRYMESYEGFVIVHGTDTMVYSASALSFMLANLRKPVILTGSQLSAIGHVRNDAQQNLITALLIANAAYSKIPNVPEVCIFFGKKLLRGNRAVKMDADGYEAYDTPNFPPLGEIGAGITIRKELLLRPGTNAFSIQEKLDTNVIDLVMFPGIQDQNILASVLQTPGLRAVVLRTYGAGNTPTAEPFLDQLRIAKERGIVVVNVSQCSRGTVQMGLYETSALLMDYGVVSGVDLTAEAALTKLMVLLGDPLLDLDEVPRRVQIATRGEQSESIYVSPLEDSAAATLSSQTPSVWFRTKGMVERPDGSVRSALLILHGALVKPPVTSDRVCIDIFLNVDQDEAVGWRHEKCACSTSRLATRGSGRSTLVFNITSATRDHLVYGRRNSFRLVLVSEGGGTVEWRSAELALYAGE